MSRDRINTNLLRVLYVGQISEHKGVHHFLECALALAKQNAAWHFDIVGGSTYTSQLEGRLRQRIADVGLSSQVVLHGAVADPSEFYRSALISVVPSLFEEPAANVVLEAKRCGVPTIVYRSGGLPELVSDKVTGWVCTEKSSIALETLMRNCLENPFACYQMERACREEYDQRFGEARFDQQWARVYLGR